METEKIYYAVIVLVCAVSMLLSPFFYMRTGSKEAKVNLGQRSWKVILLSNILMIAALLFVWWKWF